MPNMRWKIVRKIVAECMAAFFLFTATAGFALQQSPEQDAHLRSLGSVSVCVDLTWREDMTMRSLTMAAYTIKKEGWFNLKTAGEIPAYANRMRIGEPSFFRALHDPVEGFPEIVQMDGFAEIVGHAGGEEFLPVSGHGERGQGDDGNVGFCAGS